MTDFPAWLAGFWEGEGCFSLARYFHKKRNCHYWNVAIIISQSKKRGRMIIEIIQETLGYGRIVHRELGYRNRAEDWRYIISDRTEAKRFMSLVRPHLRFRIEEVESKLKLLAEVEANPHYEPKESHV